MMCSKHLKVKGKWVNVLACILFCYGKFGMSEDKNQWKGKDVGELKKQSLQLFPEEGGEKKWA